MGKLCSPTPPSAPDGTVYVGSNDKKLYAINGKTGIKLWEFETMWSSPAIGSDGTVYVGSWDKKLYAINGKTGVKLWEFETGDFVYSSPAIGSDGTVYVGSYDKKLYAINGKTGVKLWEFMMCAPPPPSALMARFTSGHRTKSSMPSMARVGSSFGNLKREVGPKI